MTEVGANSFARKRLRILGKVTRRSHLIDRKRFGMLTLGMASRMHSSWPLRSVMADTLQPFGNDRFPDRRLALADPLLPVAAFKIEWQIAYLKESSESVNDEVTA